MSLHVCGGSGDSVYTLSKQQKKCLDMISMYLAEYINTPEGISLSNDLNNYFARYRECEDVSAYLTPALTSKERKALVFIKRELKKTNRPSVQQVSHAIGCRSSRTGLRIMKSLREKGLITD